MVLVGAGCWQVYLSRFVNVVGGETHQSFFKFHIPWEKLDNLTVTGLLEPSISCSTAPCPVQEYVGSRVVAGGGHNIISSKGEPPAIPCVEVSAGHSWIPAWKPRKCSHHCHCLATWMSCVATLRHFGTVLVIVFWCGVATGMRELNSQLIDGFIG